MLSLLSIPKYATFSSTFFYFYLFSFFYLANFRMQSHCKCIRLACMTHHWHTNAYKRMQLARIVLANCISTALRYKTNL